MSRIKRKSLLTIPNVVFLTLREELDFEELGVAICLIERQFRNGIGIKDDDNLPRSLRINSRKWKRIRDRLVPHFDLTGGRWVHPAIADQIEAATSNSESSRRAAEASWKNRPSRKRKDDTETLSLFGHAEVEKVDETPAASSKAHAAPTPRQGADTSAPEETTPIEPSPGQDASKAGAQPPHPAPPRPIRSPATARQNANLRTEIINRGIELFCEAGSTEVQARRMVGTLLSDYDLGYLANALEEARSRRREIANVMGWLKTRLKRYPTRKEEQRLKVSHFASQGQIPLDMSRNPDVDEKVIGISNGMAQRLKKAAGTRRRLDLNQASG